MKLLFKTTSEKDALRFTKEAQAKYGYFAIYGFQYEANDGNFYYEVLLNEDWL